MIRKKISSFQDFLNCIEDIEVSGYDINLFRGQSSNKSLLPSICREKSNNDTAKIKKKC